MADWTEAPEFAGASVEFDVSLLEVFACPISKLPLRYDREAQELISEKAGLAYPVRNGVAVLVASEARRING
jgi:uncharacterized protein YbaR (Trm112 family)